MRMYTTTDNYYGVNEAIMSSAMAALVFGLFSAQPLTLVGAGGIISIFQSTMYSMLFLCDSREIFPQFMACTGIWAALFLWAFAVFNVCDLMKYATEFLSESFGLYLAAMYFSKLPYTFLPQRSTLLTLLMCFSLLSTYANSF